MMFSLEDNDETMVENTEETVNEPELIEDSATIEADNDAFEETSDNVATLESIAIAIEEAVNEDGEGLPPVAAEITDLAIEHICSRLGMANPKLMVGIEQFGSTNTRLAATNISLENIWDTIKEATAKMAEYVGTKFKAIGDFFKKMTSGFNARRSLVSNARKKIEKIADKKAKIPTFKDTIFDAGAFYFDSNGKNTGMATGQNCVMVLKNTVTMVETVCKVINDLSPELKFTGAKGNMTLVLAYGVKFRNIAIDGEDSEVMQFQDSLPVGGNAYESKVLKPEEMNQVLDAADEVLNAVEKMVTKDVDLNKARGKIDSALKKMKKQAETTEDKKAIAQERKNINNVASVIFRVSSKAPTISLTTVSKAVGYVNASIKQYE